MPKRILGTERIGQAWVFRRTERRVHRLWAAVILLAVAASSSAEPVRSLVEMRREQVVIQEWDLSCGAAALATLLRYQHGAGITEKDVALGLMERDVYLKQPDLVRLRQGFSLLDLKRFVDKLGYRGVGLGKLSLDDLTRRSPVLVPINTHGYNHFVVFRGQLGDRVLLADPAWGNRTMTVERFEKAWLRYGELGHVGFVVEGRNAASGDNQLGPREELFLTLF